MFIWILRTYRKDNVWTTIRKIPIAREKAKSFTDDFEPRPNISQHHDDDTKSFVKAFADDFEPIPNISQYPESLTMIVNARLRSMKTMTIPLVPTKRPSRLRKNSSGGLTFLCIMSDYQHLSKPCWRPSQKVFCV